MRAAIFIDGAYILTHMKDLDLAPDYHDIPDYLLKPLRKSFPIDLLRCYFYYCAPWMSTEPTETEKRRMAEHDAFMMELISLDRWAVRLGKLQRQWDGHRETFEQKRVDVLLSVDMVRQAAAGRIQHAILIAGDSDFIPAIEATKDSGATVSLWCGDENTVHRDLVDAADIVHRFDWKKFPSRKAKTTSPSRSAASSVSTNPIEAVQTKVAAYMRERSLASSSSSSKRRRRGPRKKTEE